MRILKWLGGIVLAIVVGFAVFIFGARFSDGPIGLVPGGPLESGDLYSGSEAPDFGFARDAMEMELQLVSPPQSRTIWLQVVDGKLYFVSGYMNSAVGKLWKKWPAQAVADGRAVVRIDGKRFAGTVERIEGGAPILDAIAAEVQRKYGAPLTAEMAGTGDAWFFAFQPTLDASSVSAPSGG